MLNQTDRAVRRKLELFEKLHRLPTTTSDFSSIVNTMPIELKAVRLGFLLQPCRFLPNPNQADHVGAVEFERFIV